MVIGLYSSYVKPQIGGYDIYRIIKPLLKYLNFAGHELRVLNDLSSEDAESFGTPSAHEWTKYLTYKNGYSDYQDCDVIFAVAIAYTNHEVKARAVDLVKNYKGLIVWYDTDADYDKTIFRSAGMLDYLHGEGLSSNIKVVCPFKNQAKLYYEDKYSYMYLPFLYDSSEEGKYIPVDQREYAIRFAGAPTYRPYLVESLYFLVNQNPSLAFDLYGSSWRGSPGWNSYDFLRKSNVSISGRFLYMEDKDFYSWLANSVVGVHIAGGSSHGYVQRLLDCLYSGVIPVTDYFEETADLGMSQYVITCAGDFIRIFNKIMNYDDSKYFSVISKLRSRMSSNYSVDVFGDKFVDFMNG